MPRKSVKTSKLAPAPGQTLPESSLTRTIVGFILYIIWLLFKLAFVFSAETCINPLTWILSMGIRGFIIYKLCWENYQDKIFDYFKQANGSTSFFILPVCLFLLWWYFTSLLMFLGAIYSRFGQRDSENEGEYSEFKTLADFANNKMRFQSYKDSMDMLTGKDKK